MKRIIAVAGAVMIIVLTGAAAKAQNSDYVCAMEDRMAELESRIRHLEALVAKAGIQDPAAAPAATKGFSDRVSVTGALEVDVNVTDGEMLNGDSSTTSDITLSTMELGMEVSINEKVSGNLVLLWEEDDTEPIAIDEGTITYQANTFALTAGRLNAPFGTYKSSFLTDPMTLSLGETAESGLLFSTSMTDNVEAVVSIANGDTDNAAMGGNANDFGVSLTLRKGFEQAAAWELGVDCQPSKTHCHRRLGSFKKAYGWDLGVQYYSDLSDSDGDIMGGVTPSKTVAGVAVNYDWSNGLWKTNVELVTAARSFDSVDMDNNGDGAGDRPSSWNLEAAYLLKPDQTVAFKLEMSDEFMDMPDLRLGLLYLWDLGDDTAFGLEYMYSKFDDSFSSGMDNSHSITSRLAIGF